MVALATLAVLAATLLGSLAQNVPTYDILSRPDIIAPELQIASINNALVYDGYTFVTPNSPTGSNFTLAMYMYNNQGGLVWSGQKFSAADYAITDFYVCNYQGSPHLCVIFFLGPVGGGTAQSSYAQIIDNTYTSVHGVAPSAKYNGKKLTQDLHEFNIVGATGASAMLSSYSTVEHPVTMPACSGAPTPQYIKTGLFTETSTDGTNTTLFQWNALDHVNVTDSYVCPGETMVGGGTNATDGFDFFHINAIDKDGDGDYIVSGRHTSTIYKIAGLNSTSGQASGSIIWHLGGKHNTFQMNTHVANAGHFNFSFQHHARFRDGGVHLWDNANDAILPSSGASSSGMGVDINETAGTATLVYQAVPPSRALDSSQGSHQILPNGNHFCGLGSVPEVFERTASGALAMDASFGTLPMQSYRAFKFAWTGHPTTSELGLLVYAHDCGAGLAYYVSWNGATTVASYRFFAANATTGAGTRTGTAATTSKFETMSTTTTFALYGYVQALDSSGNVLGTTPRVRTFIPGSSLAAKCSNVRCPPGTNYKTAPKTTCSS